MQSQLTPRQLEVLKTSINNTDKEGARKLHISISTYEHLKAQGRERLGCKNQTQAVLVAIHLGKLGSVESIVKGLTS